MVIASTYQTGTREPDEKASPCGVLPTPGRIFLGMTDPETFDPFAGITDEEESTPKELRARLLASTKRGYVPLRKIFVQRPKGSAQLESKPDRPSIRASSLADLVTGRQERALDLLLLVHALWPVLDGTPLALSVWAKLLSVKSPCTPAGARAAITTLEQHQLLHCHWEKRIPVLAPLLEDGSGEPWTKAGAKAEEGPGYFTIPHDYWNLGFSEDLKLPGKAMLLIIAADTQSSKTPAFKMAYERAKEWYGISERTAERGYAQLRKAEMATYKIQKVKDDRHPAGRRTVYWWALNAPFSTISRAHLQKKASTAAKAAINAAGPSTAP